MNNVTWKQVAIGAVALNVAVLLVHLKSRWRKTRRKRDKSLGTVRIYFMRHAQTDNNTRSAEKDKGNPVGERNPDANLTELGKTQAVGAANFIRDNLDLLGIKTVYCSPMKKTLLTLHPFVKILGDKLQFRLGIDLFERGGIYSGERTMTPQQRESLQMHYGLNWKQMTDLIPKLKFDEIETEPYRYNKDWGVGKDMGWHSGIMETQKIYFERVNRVCEWLYALKSNTLIITHGKHLDTLLKCLIASRVEDAVEYNFLILHQACGLTCLELSGNRAALLYVNHSTLPQEQRTGHSMGKCKLSDEDCRPKIRSSGNQL